MKNKILPFGLVCALLAGTFLITKDAERTYTPLSEREESSNSIGEAFEYLTKRMVNPETGELKTADVVRSRREVDLHLEARGAAATTLEWEEMGPNNVGGRTRAILIDQDNHDLMYAGGVSGGLWVSHSAGRAWYQAKGADGNILPSMIISSIAQAPNGDVYVGTGEMSHVYGGGGSGFIGNGLWKKEAGLDYFTQIQTVQTSDIGASWRLVNELAVQENGTVYAATSGGLLYSTDRGDNWMTCKQSQNSLILPGACEDVKVGSDGSIAASVGGAFYYSLGSPEGFASKPVADADYPQAAGFERMEISIAESNPEYVYCVQSTGGGNGVTKGVYRSTDRGDSWEIIAKPDLSELNFGTQMTYDMVIAVDPSDEDKIFVGGLDLWSWSLNEGWEKRTQWYYAGAPQFTNYLHADQHELIFHPEDPKVMYSGNDGGVFKSTDGGLTFTHMNRGYNVTQFYAMGYSKYGEAAGGTQDNGTQLVGWKAEYSNSDIVQGATPQAGFEIAGGDGGYTLFSRINPDVIFSEYVNAGDIRRSNDKGLTQNDEWAGFIENRVEETGANWITPYALYENLDDPLSIETVSYVNTQLDTNNLDTLWAGEVIELTSAKTAGGKFDYTLTENLLPNDTITVRDPFSSVYVIGIGTGSLAEIWMSRNSMAFTETTEWFKLSDDVYGTPSCMEFSADGNYLFLGTENGRLYRFSNINYARTEEQGDVEGYSYLVDVVEIVNFNGTVITGLSVDKNDPNRLAVSLGGYGLTGSRVELTTNALSAGEVNFISVHGDLPVMPAYDVLFNVTDSAHLFVATENGVWSTSLEYQAATSPETYQDTVLILDEVLDSEGEFSHYDTTFVINEVQITQSLTNIPAISWTQENVGLGNVPSFMLEQQWYEGEFYGQMYVGTHGRGIFKSGTFTVKDEFYLEEPTVDVEDEVLNAINVYPNPATDITKVQFTVEEELAEATLFVYDLTGKKVWSEQADVQQGFNEWTVEVADLPRGTYLIHLSVAGESHFSKMVKAY